jgi:hypothetical protein
VRGPQCLLRGALADDGAARRARRGRRAPQSNRNCSARQGQRTALNLRVRS